MKAIHLSLGLLALGAVSALAQGTVNFNNIVSGCVRAPVYGPEAGNSSVSKVGNTASGFPAGTQVYTGTLLNGAGYQAQLFAALGPGAPESALMAVTPTTTFRSAPQAGFVLPVTDTLQGVPPGTVATVQMRAWDNSSGQYPDWASASPAWLSGLIAAGKSPLVDVLNTGGGVPPAPPAPLCGLLSFNLYSYAPPLSPTAVTLPPTNVASASAVLQGTFNPNGNPAHGWFAWGIGTNYGNATPAVDLGNGTSAVTLSATLSLLTASTTYHYRAVVYGGFTTNYGADVAFATPAAGPSPVVTNVSSRGNCHAFYVAYTRPMNTNGVYTLVGSNTIAGTVTSLTVTGLSYEQGNSNLIRVAVTPDLLPDTNVYYVTIQGPTASDGAGLAPNPTVAGFVHGQEYPPVQILYSRWSGDSFGDNVYNFMNSPRYLTTPPDIRSNGFVRFETPWTDDADNYGDEAIGFWVAPSTANYTFWGASDDTFWLFLATDRLPAHKQRIALEPAWANYRAFADAGHDNNDNRGNPPLNSSLPLYPNGIPLTQGQVVYLQLDHTEGVGGDHFSVTYTTDGSTPANGTVSLLSSAQFQTMRLAPDGTIFSRLCDVSCNLGQTDATSFAGGTLTFNADPDGTPPYFIQWRSNGVLIAGATSPLYTTAPLNPANEGDVYQVAVSNTFSTSGCSVTAHVPPNPVVLSVSTRNDPTHIYVRYNKPVLIAPDPSTQYAVSQMSDGSTIFVANAVYGASHSEVVLGINPNDPINRDTTGLLIVSGVTDDTAALNPIVPNPTVLPFSQGPGRFCTDFSEGLPAGTTASGTTPPAVGADGALHLTEATNSQQNFWTVPLSSTQSFSFFKARWRQLLGAGSGGIGNSADGMSFNLGESLGFPAGAEEGGDNGLSVTVDTYNNGPTPSNNNTPNETGIEIRWNGTRLQFLPIGGTPFGSMNGPPELLKNTWVNASVDVTASGVVTFNYDTYTITAQIPNYSGITANQCVFAARTGGANELCEIDDLCINDYVLGPITVTVTPANPTVPECSSITLAATLSGSPPDFGPQWYRNGVLIPGAIGYTYTTPVLSRADDGTIYSATASNLFSQAGGATVIHVPPDNTPPTIVSVGSIGGCNVGIRFSKPVDPATATDPTRYSLNGQASGLGIVPDTLAVRPDGVSVIFEASPCLAGAFTIAETNVLDQCSGLDATNSRASGAVLPLLSQDITDTAVGVDPSPAGTNFSFFANEIEIETGGSDLWQNHDHDHFVYAQRCGDLDMVVKVASMTVNSPWSKAGLIARLSLDAGAPFVSTCWTPPTPPGANQIESAKRYAWNGGVDDAGYQIGPRAASSDFSWLRLRRMGDEFIAYHSADGVTWLPSADTAGALCNNLNDTNGARLPNLYVGVFATPNNNGTLEVAHFENFSLTPPGLCPGVGPTLTVVNTNDSGLGSLRQAILDANTRPGVDTIIFSIPGCGVHTIQLLAPLPDVAAPVAIDGYTQPGSQTNSLTVGDNAVMGIELCGLNAGPSANGLNILASNCVVRGLVINRFQGSGLSIHGPGNRVEGNFIGVDATGSNAFPNLGGGVYLNASFNQIGGTSAGDRNVISGNGTLTYPGPGIYISGELSGVSNGSNVVQGNYIGTDASGARPFGNSFDGVYLLQSPGNQIGGPSPGAGNVIAGNGRNGITSEQSPGTVIQGNQVGADLTGAAALGNAQGGITILDSSGCLIGGIGPGVGNTIAFNGGVGVGVAANTAPAVNNGILGNLIFGNTGLDIDLNMDGFTPNDPGDTDSGPNNLQNFPILTSATTAGSTTVQGSLNSLPNQTFRLEFFGSETLIGPNIGEAHIFFGAVSVTANSDGNASFSVALPVAAGVGLYLCATATDPQNNTSELSPAVPVGFQFGIGSLSASQAPVGSTINIYGTNFSLVPGDNIVYFGAVRATVASAGPTNLVVVVPPGAAYGPISVTLAGLTVYSSVPFVPTFPSAFALTSQSFAPAFNLPAGTAQSGMAIGDLDGDGRPDLIVSVRTNSVTAFLYQNVEPGGDLTPDSFVLPLILLSPGEAIAVALADIDGDGLLDVIVLKNLPDRVEVWRNQSTPGDLSFAPPSAFGGLGDSLGGSLGALAIADIDGDGLPDIIATSSTNNVVAVFRNTSTPGSIALSPHVDFPAGFVPATLAVVDFDGDGKPDILVGHAYAGIAFSVLRNLSLPGAINVDSFAPFLPIANGANASAGIVAADFDGDGKPDIAVALPAATSLAIYRNNSSPGSINALSFYPPFNLPCPGGPLGVAVADLDGDGKLDLLCANSNSTSVSVFKNQALPGVLTANSFAPRLDLAAGFRSFLIGAGDFDLDGKPDLVVLGNAPDHLAFFRNKENEPFFLINGVPPPGDTMLVTNSATVQIVSSFITGAIYYTLDGSPPDPSSARYSNTFLVVGSVILRAGVFDANGRFVAEAPALNLQVATPPIITQQPQSQTVNIAEDVLFTAAASGVPPPTFQWTRNGIGIPGATNSFLFLPSVSPPRGGSYAVTASNPYGTAQSVSATLTIRTTPSITAQPTNSTAATGASATFSASVTGAGPIAYQWRRNGANIAGATNSTLTLTNIQFGDGASYTVAASSPGGIVVAGPAQLFIGNVTAQAGGDNFAAASVLNGDSGSIAGTNTFATRELGEPLHAGKPGSNSVWYTWTPTNRGIATLSTVGSTFDTLLGIYTGVTVTNLTVIAADDDGGGFLASKISFNVTGGTTYHIAIDGFNGQKGRYLLNWSLEQTSDTVPIVTCPPASQTVPPGGVAFFTVSVTGSNLVYQWSFNGAGIVGATNPLFVRTNVQPAQVGLYSVRISAPGNRSVESVPAILEIGPDPNVQSLDKPGDANPLCLGSFAAFSRFAEPRAGAFGSGGGASVAMGSIGFQSLVSVSTNNVADCSSPTCPGIPDGTRYLELNPATNGIFVLDTSGSASLTRMWVCAKGTNNLDLTITFIKCDTGSAPDGRSLVEFVAQGGRTYQVWIARLDTNSGPLQLNWKLGLPPVLYSLTSDGFHTEGDGLSLTALATNVIAPGVTTPLPSPTFGWYFNGATYLGSGSIWTIPNLAAAHAGQYSVIASNAIGVTSAVVRLELHGKVTSPVVNDGGGVELFADDTTAACLGGHATYQWSSHGMALAGETNRSLILHNVQPAGAGPYDVTVTNCFGATTYTASQLAVTVDVGLVVQLSAGGHVTLTWRAIPAKHYRVDYSGSLTPPVWTQLGSSLLAVSTSLSVTDLITTQPRFYRLVLLD